jgi:hypothetical protein
MIGIDEQFARVLRIPWIAAFALEYDAIVIESQRDIEMPLGTVVADPEAGRCVGTLERALGIA